GCKGVAEDSEPATNAQKSPHYYDKGSGVCDTYVDNRVWKPKTIGGTTLTIYERHIHDESYMTHIYGMM
ncbi:hypothetical protein HAX54_044448, partial [Datura stramonium]|nr:hypothetical protein [Datura stramonium]